MANTQSDLDLLLPSFGEFFLNQLPMAFMRCFLWTATVMMLLQVVILSGVS